MLKNNIVDTPEEAPQGAFFVGGGWNFRGYKKGGGGSGSTPIETADSLHSISYAKVLDLVSEGEIKGLVNGMESIYLNETPLQNPDKTFNFQRVSVDFRNGTQFQDHIAGFPASETSEAIGVEVTRVMPWVKAVTSPRWSAVRITVSVPGLQSINQSTGDVLGWQVDYAIDLSVDGGPFVEVLQSTFWGKTTSTYARTHRVDLPKSGSGWQLRVRRVSENSTSSTISDKTYVQDFTYVQDGKLRHPNSALVGLQVDAKQFSNIPTRAYDLEGLIISVPTNYNPVTRVYTGTWDGTFKQAYSNNPAWVFYDMALNGRYGLGSRIKKEHFQKHKWELYKIGMYCDQMVDDGYGGQEPRFTCNAYFQVQVDAYRAFADIASIFRGITYWGEGTVIPVADMPSEDVIIYTNANVVNGLFGYAASPWSKRYTVALVSWNDPKDFYRQKVEAYEYAEGIERYGINKVEVSAFGCTSQGQAKRLAKWTVLTSCLETETISFSVGLTGAVAVPGRIIKIADEDRAGRRIGGRIRSATKISIELDAAVEVRPGDRLRVTLPSGVTEERIVKGSDSQLLTADTTLWTADTTELRADMTGLPNAVTTIEVKKAFSELPEAEAVWTLESEKLTAQTFRVLSVADDGGGTFSISAVQHVPEKFDMVDYGTRFDPPPKTIVPPRVQPAPANVRISNYSTVSQGLERINARIEWDQTEYAVEYEVQWRRDGSDWVPMPRTGVLGAEIENAYMGEYEARVRAFSAIQATSLWSSSVVTRLNGTIGEPPIVTHLTTRSLTFAIQMDWGFPEQLSVIDNTEIWYSQTSNRDDAIRLVNLPYPQRTHQVLIGGAGRRLYFWARLVDKNGAAGAFYPDGSGVLGVSSADADDILELLTDKISETQLAQALLERIESAEGAAVSVEQIATDLAAMYNIKCQFTQDGVPYFAGIGVGVENNEGVITSQILLAAERVAILDVSSGKMVTPFLVQGGQVFINDAIIGKLSADHIQVSQLSELTQDAGILVSGKLQGKNTNSFIDLNATGNGYVANWGNGAMTVTANGRLAINQVDVVNTVNIAGEAISTTVVDVRDSAFSIDPVCSNYEHEAYVQSINYVVVKNITPGSALTVRPEILAKIYGRSGEGVVYAALRLLRNGIEVRRTRLNFGFFSATDDKPQWMIPLTGSSFTMVDRPSATAEINYSAEILLWHSSRHVRVHLDMFNSALHVEVKRK